MEGPFRNHPLMSGSKCKRSGGINSTTLILYTIRLKMSIFSKKKKRKKEKKPSSKSESLGMETWNLYF